MDLDASYKLNLSNYSALQTKMNNMKDQSEKSVSKFSINIDDEASGNEVSSKLDENRKQELDKLKNVSDEFESLLINEMLKAMKKTINKTGLIDGGMTEDIFGDMLYTEYSKSFSKSKTFGISDMIYKQMETYI